MWKLTVASLLFTSLLSGCVADTDLSDTAVSDTELDAPSDVATDGDPQDLADTIDTTSSDVAPDGVNDGPTLTIVVEGSMEDRSPADGLSSQTPIPYFYHLRGLQLLESAEDTIGDTVFDYSPGHVRVDMTKRNEVAVVPLRTLPLGTYTHFRIQLAAMDVEVEASLHNVPTLGDWDGRLNILYALSNTEIAGHVLAQGDVLVTPRLATSQIFRFFWPVSYPEPAPKAWAEAVNGETWVTFELATPLMVSAEGNQSLTFVIRYYIAGSFRWLDSDANLDYTAGKWDLTIGSPMELEEVVRFGANAFEVFAE